MLRRFIRTHVIIREAAFLRDGKLLLRITLVLVLCLLARQSSAYVKILTAPGHPVSLIVEHDEGRIRKAFFRSPEGVRPLEHIEQHLLLSDSLTFLCADDDILDDLVWKIDLLQPKTEKMLSLWITSVTEASTAWLALAPAGAGFWESLPRAPLPREDVFLYIAPHLPAYQELGQRSGPEILTFIYTMLLTKNGPKLAAVPEIYRQFLPLTALVCRAQENKDLKAAYTALHQDFERMGQGGMPSREAIDNFLWKRILTVRWKR